MLNLAIKHKQIRFIRNIIERNANIKTFLTVERFEEILRENTPSNCLFYELMIKKSKSADPQKWTFEHFEGVSFWKLVSSVWNKRVCGQY